MAYGITLHKPVRTLVAMVVADVVGTFAIVCMAWLLATWETYFDDLVLSFLASAELAGVLAAIGLFVWCFIGLPIHMLRISRGKATLWRYVWPAAILGGLTGLIYVPLFALTGPVGCLIGTTNAAIFWLIRRPDRDNIAVPKAIKTA